MNRRGFLGAMLGAVAGATLDPERLLWVPGRKVISIPRTRVFTPQEMADTKAIMDRLVGHYYSRMWEEAMFKGTGWVRLSYENGRMEIVHPLSGVDIQHRVMVSS